MKAKAKLQIIILLCSIYSFSTHAQAVDYSDAKNWAVLPTFSNDQLKSYVKDFEESFRAAEVRFNSGVINSAEYLISKNNLDRTKINLAQSKYEYLFRTKLLDYFQGKQVL